MWYHSRSLRAALVAGLIGVGVLVSSAPASAAAITVDLCVEAGTLALPGGASAPIWGFASAVPGPGGQPGCAGVAPGLPGPVLSVQQGDTVQVVLHNDLAVPVGFEIPGVRIAAGDTLTPAHGAGVYAFVAADPGTYGYDSPADAGRQLAMGLYGALVVRPPVAGRAYAGADTAYDREAVLVLSAIDPAFNAAPAAADPHEYRATYWLVNGRAYPQTDPVHAGAPGQRVLLRFVNAGYDNTTMALLGTHERVIARDARPLAVPFLATAETVPAGATEDAIVTVPAAGTRFALYNRQLHLTNGPVTNPAHAAGGMMTFLVVP